MKKKMRNLSKHCRFASPSLRRQRVEAGDGGMPYYIKCIDSVRDLLTLSFFYEGILHDCNEERHSCDGAPTSLPHIGKLEAA